MCLHRAISLPLFLALIFEPYDFSVHLKPLQIVTCWKDIIKHKTYILHITIYNNMKTTISIEETTRELLKEYGIKGETYDNLILRLLKEIDKCRGDWGE